MIDRIYVQYRSGMWDAFVKYNEPYTPGYTHPDRLSAVGKLVEILLAAGIPFANSVEIVRI